MRYKVVKYRRVRFLFLRSEHLRNVELFFLRQDNFDLLFSFFSRYKVSRFCINGSLSRFRNFCFVTGRVRGFVRLFCLSRCLFRVFVGEGILVGIRKALW
jgi:ribosomal protein S14